MQLLRIGTRWREVSLVLAAMLLPPRLFAGDITFFLLAKAEEFGQADPGQPIPSSKEYQIFAQAAYSTSNSLISAAFQPTSAAWSDSLKPAPANTVTYTGSDKTLAGLDSDFPDGDYQFIFNTVHDGVSTNTLPLQPPGGADPYPVSPPHISNFAAIQGFDPSKPLTLQWDPFMGAGGTDFITVTMVNIANTSPFESPFPGQPGVLPGTATSVTIPANTFPATTTLGCQIMFCKVVYENSNSYPGATGVAGYAARTAAVFVSGAASNPPAALELQTLPRTAMGQFQLQLSGQPGLQYVIEAAAAFPTTTWVPLTTNVAVNGKFTFVDQQSTGFPSRFYRARSAQ